MKQCPRCDESIGDSATACRCGWKDRKPNAFNPTGGGRYVERKCAREACYVPAMPGHTLCEYHYVEAHQKAALDKCAELGLHTTEQMRAWFKANARKVGKLPADRNGSRTIEENREIARQLTYGEITVSREREPGQDDEWREDYQQHPANLLPAKPG